MGLLASLAPPVTYASASSGEPSSDVLAVWPGWGVQQDLGALRGTVGTFRIDVSAEPGADHVTLWASLVDASTLEVVRETFIDATPSYVPVSRTLEFPAYVVPAGQRLLLQLLVAHHERYHAIFRLAHPQPDYANLMLNGVPDSGSGPLVFSHLETVSGLRAAIQGVPSERLRLVVAVVFAVLAGLTHPVAAAGLRRLGSRVLRLACLRAPLYRRGLAPDAAAGPDAAMTLWSRLLGAPWYPWPIAAIPILHFLSSNPLHFAAREAVLPIIAALAVVTVCVGCLRLLLGDWHRPAAVTSAVTVVFFAFGHVDGTLDGRLDESAFLAIAVVVAATASAAIIFAGARAAGPTRFLNLAATVLLVFPLAGIAADVAESLARRPQHQGLAGDNLAAHLFPEGLPTVTGARPDIYYIILDAYVRADALREFDNSVFLEELRQRGFYVASEAISNYTSSDQSIASSLNMSYLDALHQRPQAANDDWVAISQAHALGAVLKNLGYTYVHLDSGFVFTNESPLADTVVRFTPAGTLVSSGSGGGHESHVDSEVPIVSSIFVRALVQTTVLRSIIGHRFLLSATEPYDFHSPHRALQMFEFLTGPIESSGPKFVFAHFGTPHPPSVFDRYGNYIVGDSSVGFLNTHDQTVPNAYTGELIYINSLVIKMIDGIMSSHQDPPVIVIASDHGRTDECSCPHSILAAFHLPDGGSDGIYESISSVNHFRYILDYYFGFNLGLLDDVEVSPSS